MAAWGPVYGLVVGGVLGLLFGLVYLLLNPATGTVSIGMNVGPVSGLVLGLIVGAFLGLLAGVVDGLGGGFRLIQPVSKMSQSWVALRRCLYAGLFWGLFQGLTFYLLIDIGAEPSNAFQLGLIGVLVGSVIAGFRPVKLARWSGWTSSIDGWTRSNNLLERQRSGLVFGLLVGLSFSLLIGLVVGLLSGLEYGLRVMLTAAWTSVADIRTVTVPVGLMGGVLFGTLFEPKAQAELVEPAETQTPNQGIKLSVQNALKLGICFGIVGLGIGLWLGWSLGELYLGLIFGLFLGLGGGLIGGADSVVKHYLLRALLYSEGLIPHHYARFLDYCVKLTFLHRSGGSYLFIHRLFMEHVAQLDDDRIAAISRNVKSFQE